MTGIRLMTVLCAMLLVAAPARSDVLLAFEMDGSQVSPPVQTPGFGGGSVTLDPQTGAIELVGTYQDMLGDVIASHIHGLVGGQPLLIPIENTGGTAGALSLSATLSQTEVAAVLSETSFVNVHTTEYPAGEILGTIVIVPEPAAFVALLTLLAAAARRPA